MAGAPRKSSVVPAARAFLPCRQIYQSAYSVPSSSYFHIDNAHVARQDRLSSLLSIPLAMRSASLARNLISQTRLSSVKPFSIRMSSTSSSATLSLRPTLSPTPLTPPVFYRPSGSQSHPPHWKSPNPLTQSPKGFRSPWPSDDPSLNGFISFFKARFGGEWIDETNIGKKGEGLPEVRRPVWIDPQEEGAATAMSKKERRSDGQLRYTWLGHASCHLQVPIPLSSKTTTNLTIMTDPVFSERCSPFQFMGPARYTESPVTINQLSSNDQPAGAWPDVVLISHNHYDHLDLNTLKEMTSRPNGKECPLFVVPLGLKTWFKSNLKGIPEEKLVELDWWEERILEVKVGEGEGKIRIVATPAQHFSGRGLFDRDHSLWVSYAVHVLDPQATPTSEATPLPLARIWFSGDSGYRSVPRGTPPSLEQSLPHCPAFSEIGSLLGPFDLSLIACGAYNPRSFMSRIHANPSEALNIHQDVKSRKSFGIHHSTFPLTTENILEPRERWIKEGKERGLDVGNLEIGETRIVEYGEAGREAMMMMNQA